MKVCLFFCGSFRIKLPALAFATILALHTASAQSGGATPAEPTASHASIVGEVSIQIPPPAKDMIEYGPDKGRVDSFVPPYNRLVIAFVPIEDKDAVVSVDKKAPPRLALVQVSRQYESMNISESGFRTIIGDVAKKFDTTVESYAKENEEEFNRRLKSLDIDNPKIAFEKPISLGFLFDEPNAAAFGTVLQASAGSASTKKALSVIYMRVKDRVLFAYFFMDYKDQGTLLELRKTSEAWARAILKANP
jgi:hypothetical protein